MQGGRRLDALSRLATWPGAYLDGSGCLVGLWGLAVDAVSDHRLAFDQQEPIWAWCAFDPLFIAPLIGATARVTSQCPVTGESVSLTVGADAVTAVAPAGAVVSFVSPEAPFDAEIRQTFCHFVHFFSSPDAAEGWTARHPGTFWLSLPEAAEVGRRLSAAVFPEVSVAGRR